MITFPNFQDELSSHKTDLHPSELHGRLIGYACAVQAGSDVDRRSSLYRTWLDGDVSDGLREILEAAHSHALEHLDEFSDFEFALLMPSDDEPIGIRAGALAHWCSGFLSGFGESGRNIEGEDVKEAMQDLSRIAAMTDDVPEGEENEVDLNEIIEFVRVSVLLVFAGLKPTGAH